MDKFVFRTPTTVSGGSQRLSLAGRFDGKVALCVFGGVCRGVEKKTAGLLFIRRSTHRGGRLLEKRRRSKEESGRKQGYTTT